MLKMRSWSCHVGFPPCRILGRSPSIIAQIQLCCSSKYLLNIFVLRSDIAEVTYCTLDTLQTIVKVSLIIQNRFENLDEKIFNLIYVFFRIPPFYFAYFSPPLWCFIQDSNSKRNIHIKNTALMQRLRSISIFSFLRILFILYLHQIKSTNNIHNKNFS